MSQSPSPPLSGSRGFTRGERGTEQRDQGRRLKSCLRAEEHSPSDKASDGLVYIILVPHHPGSMVEGQEISWSWNA